MYAIKWSLHGFSIAECLKVHTVVMVWRLAGEMGYHISQIETMKETSMLGCVHFVLK